MEYFATFAGKQTDKNKGITFVGLKYLANFTGGALRSNEVNVKFCNDFKAYLQMANSLRSKNNEIKLSENTVHGYFKQFRLSLKTAFNDGVIKENIFPLVNPLPQAETHREFLFQEELQALVNTPCHLPLLKAAALFSALTGLRFSDIEKMKWSEIRHSDKDGYLYSLPNKKPKAPSCSPFQNRLMSCWAQGARPKPRFLMGLNILPIQICI